MVYILILSLIFLKRKMLLLWQILTWSFKSVMEPRKRITAGYPPHLQSSSRPPTICPNNCIFSSFLVLGHSSHHYFGPIPLILLFDKCFNWQPHWEHQPSLFCLSVLSTTPAEKQTQAKFQVRFETHSSSGLPTQKKQIQWDITFFSSNATED